MTRSPTGSLVELAPRRRRRERLSSLTPREREVLALMAVGLANEAIAARLGLRTRTVETHVRGIFAAFGLRPDQAHHRRVLAVLIYRGREPAETDQQ